MKNIGETIAKYRKSQKLSQGELAEKLKAYGLNPSAASVSSWEKNVSIPNAVQIFGICEVLGIKDIFSEFISSEGGLLGGLNSEGIKKVMDYASLLRLSDEYRTHKEPVIVEISPKEKSEAVRKKRLVSHAEELVRRIRLYDLPVSAGTGQFLDGEDYEEIDAPSDTPASAQFGVRIAGNSMEPRYLNGQVVWVKKCERLMDGEIGIFLLNGDAYIKKLYVTEDGVSLISLNPSYKPIKVLEGDTFITLGKVLS